MTKPAVTKTLGPIHFEDLDPHRFEDLVRELIYDYKDWQTIEATGRSGTDEGFDVRAYEKTSTNSQAQDDEDDEREEADPMAGNLWMIQAKREKEIGPKRIREIISDVDTKSPPYGYILAASANFSKESYDAFREELRKKGVMEFHLWGKAELEDMLHFPKNDRILFAFFGISLVSRRRSRVTEIRKVVINKNKLLKIFGDAREFYQSVLVRDAKDSHYPHKEEYKDFKDHPRWKEYRALQHYPTGLIVALRKYHAYIDIVKKEYDYAESENLIFLESDSHEDKSKRRDDSAQVEKFWEYFPHRNQATFFKNGLIRFDDMLVIDDKGDSFHKFPHIFVDFDSKTGPIGGSYAYLEVGKTDIRLEGYTRISKFPKTFPEQKVGKIYKEKNGITLADQDFSMLKHDNGTFNALYACDNKYDHLKQKDAVRIENPDGNSSSKYYLLITHVESMKLKDYLEKYPDLKWMVERQIGEGVSPNKALNVFEFKKTFDFAIEREKNGSGKNRNLPGVL
jgi:hypothetical protein